MAKTRSYGEDWNAYVRDWKEYAAREPGARKDQEFVYPGDEWGNQEEWDRVTNRYLLPLLPDDDQGIAVELGGGSGKYTSMLIDHVSRILCFDVSEDFMAISAERLRNTTQGAHKAQFERLKLRLCYEIRDRIVELGLGGKVDLVFSIAAMQHVELHTLMAYFISAASILKPGGYLSMTVASAGNPEGFQRVLEETPWCYGNERPSQQFYFLSPQILRTCLEGLGYHVEAIDEGRDITVVARTTDRTPAALEQAHAIMKPHIEAVAIYERDRPDKA